MDVRGKQLGFEGCIAVNHEPVGFLADSRGLGLVAFQDDELRRLALQLTSHGTAHAAGAADDIVPLQTPDVSFHSSPAKKIVELEFEQRLPQGSEDQEVRPRRG